MTDWIFRDRYDQLRVGAFQRFSDHGGTDVTYWFLDTTDGSLHLVSGQRLKEAKPLHERPDVVTF